MKLPFRRIIKYFLTIVAAVVGVFAVEVLAAIYGKSDTSNFVNPDHRLRVFGQTGARLIYVVIGDSTGAGRGAPYLDGIAVKTAEHLAKDSVVAMTNFSISGAVAADVIKEELKDAAALRPDLVLLSVGANDATHFTPSSKLSSELNTIVTALIQANPDVKIVVTGSPQLGSVPRFAQPLRWFAGSQTARVNRVFAKVVQARKLTWAHIADETGSIFAKDHTLFAADDFHPIAIGYAVWMPILNKALDQALTSDPR